MDNREDDSTTSCEHHIQKQEEWHEQPWFSGMHMLRDHARTNSPAGKTSSADHPFQPSNVHRSSKEAMMEEFNMGKCNFSGNESTLHLDSFKPIPIPIQQLSRPPMVRSYGSSSASSASTLMTPSWASSVHSPSYMETVDSIPTSNPYQIHILQSKIAKDISSGDFPTSRDFRFPSHPMSASPESPEMNWFLEDNTEALTLPFCSYRERTEPKRSKKARTLGCGRRDAVQTHKAHKGTDLPGLGIISLDGSYNKGMAILSKSKARHGPLTPEQRHEAALMRRHGACRDCRKRKIKVRVLMS